MKLNIVNPSVGRPVVQCLAQQIQKLPFDLGEAFYLNSVKLLHARSLGFAGFAPIFKARLFGKLEHEANDVHRTHLHRDMQDPKSTRGRIGSGLELIPSKRRSLACQIFLREEAADFRRLSGASEGPHDQLPFFIGC